MACRGIYRPPYVGARSLLEWGIDVWPYINGKAIVNGLQLADMSANDMLDVFHYFLEEDLNFSTAEQAEARDKTRASVYRNLYNREYKFGKQGGTAGRTYVSENVGQPEEAPIEPFSPAAKQTKPYTAPTQFNPDAARPFGSILDEPLGH